LIQKIVDISTEISSEKISNFITHTFEFIHLILRETDMDDLEKELHNMKRKKLKLWYMFY